MSERNIIKGLDAYIEFANETKRFSDAGFYEDIKARIAELEAELKQREWIKDDLLRDIIECEASPLEDPMTVCIHYDTLNNILDKYLPSPPITEKDNG